MPSKPTIIIRKTATNDRIYNALPTLAAAAKHLDCTITTIKTNVRALGGHSFHGRNVKTGAQCYFRKAQHNNKLVAVKHHSYMADCPRYTVKAYAARFLGVTSSALDHKLPTPGIWLVRNITNDTMCYITYTSKRR